MAKGNLFQGMARGKVGDVVFYRMDGEQMSRVRNRHPKNPKTIAQLYQRAIMATIVRAYSAGSEIFDHSFQGKQVGMENMRTFLSRNMAVLRAAIQQDITQNTAFNEQLGTVVAPKSITPVPVAGLIVSEGTLSQDFFDYSSLGDDNVLQLKTPAIGEESTITLQDWVTNAGLRAGDIFTFVAFCNNDNKIMYQVPGSVQQYGTQYSCQFGWYRLTVKSTISTKQASTATFSDLFDIETDGNVFLGSIASKTVLAQTIPVTDLFLAEPKGATFAIIRSRDDSKMRSTTEMVEVTPEESYGIKSTYIIEAWEKEVDSLGNSELILEGGDVDGTTNIPPLVGDGGGSGVPPMGGD